MTQYETAADTTALHTIIATPEEAWQLFDSLPPVNAVDIATGRWRGEELHTGHPMNGVLPESGWYGKQFDTTEHVHPLLFHSGAELIALDPRKVPIALAAHVPPALARMTRRLLPMMAPVLRTRQPTARLRDIEYRGVTSAAMIYDRQPIIDHFRALHADILFGVMDHRGTADPYFFLLYQDRTPIPVVL